MPGMPQTLRGEAWDFAGEGDAFGREGRAVRRLFPAGPIHSAPR